MNLLSRNELKALAEKQPGPSVSIFMPTHRASTETRQDSLRFKNLLREAEEGLIANGLRRPEARFMLEPARQLGEDGLFWRHQGDGLAVFLSAEVFRYYCLPLALTERLAISQRFHLNPLLPLLTGAGHFYLLALSQKEIRLLQGTRDRVDEIELDNVPNSLAEALKIEGSEKQLQFRTTGSGGLGRQPAIFHGHGGEAGETKDRLRRSFRQIDAGLRDLLRDEQAPLILAGVDYLLPLYREVNSYPYLLDWGITGNPERLSPQVLHEQSWAMLRPYFQQELAEAAAQYEQLAGTGRTSVEVKEIVPAAAHGRVGILWVALGCQQGGSFEPETGVVQLYQQPEPGAEDLLDLAAIQTFVNGGRVYVVKPPQMPDDAPLAAIFRY